MSNFSGFWEFAGESPRGRSRAAAGIAGWVGLGWRVAPLNWPEPADRSQFPPAAMWSLSGQVCSSLTAGHDLVVCRSTRGPSFIGADQRGNPTTRRISSQRHGHHTRKVISDGSSSLRRLLRTFISMDPVVLSSSCHCQALSPSRHGTSWNNRIRVVIAWKPAALSRKRTR
jgi:hypothetical protein